MFTTQMVAGHKHYSVMYIRTHTRAHYSVFYSNYGHQYESIMYIYILLPVSLAFKVLI